MIGVFVDSDGVLFDFDSHVAKYSGGITPNKLGDDNLWKLVNANPDFWITMPMFPWAKDLIRLLKPYNPTVLTGCPKSNYEYAAEQKKLKYATNFPGLPVITCLSKNKPDHMKNPGDLLIDDMSKNCARWSKAGGKVIQFKNYDKFLIEFANFMDENDW